MLNRATQLTPQALRTGLAVFAGAALLTGATWRGLAAEPTVAEPTLAQTTRPSVGALAGGRETYADVVAVAAPAVVTIRTEGTARFSPTAFPGDEGDLLRRFFGDRFERSPRSQRAPRQRGLGSGVVVSQDGYILTNHHVVANAERITVDFKDKRTMTAKLIGSDQPSDLALLKVEATGLTPLALGDSDGVRVGDVVLAVGNPLGIGQTVTMGIISAKGRSTGVGDGSYEDFLQTDAPINHGNSGGALVNLKGELVGINSQILSMSDGNIGIGFAIPANMARHVMDQLRTEGHVRRAQLGVTVQPVTSDLAESLGLKQVDGAIVSSVEKGSAAERAGVKRGDVITSFNGQSVQDTNALRNRVANTKPGATAKVEIIRDGRAQELDVKLDEAATSTNARSDQDGADGKAVLGVAVAPLTPESAARAGLDRDAKGLLVQDVDPDGRASAAGIQPNDVIQEVDRKPVESVEQLREAVKAVTERPLLLLVNRDGRSLFLTVRPS